jgi:methionine-rich copper-binding protein CopC
VRVCVLGLAATALALLGLVTVPSPAAAHASLLASTPEAGDVLEALPDQVVLEFTEAVSPPAYVNVRSPDGDPVMVGDPVVRGAVVTQALTDGELPGTYSLAYRVVSEDGHPLTGEVVFSVGEPVESPSGSVTPLEPADRGDPGDPASVAPRRRVDVAVPAVLFALALLMLGLSRRA